MATTKEQIVHLLATNDKAVARALVALNARQTADERATENTKYNNGRGFRPCHARMGTSMAEFYLKRGYLSPKQVAYWRVPQSDGKMRIEIYAGQLLIVAQEKAAAATEETLRNVPVQKPRRDVGNLMEEKIVLEETLETEADEMKRERIYDRLIQIDEAMDEVARCEYKMARDEALA
jgi:hypothetical protein